MKVKEVYMRCPKLLLVTICVLLILVIISISLTGCSTSTPSITSSAPAPATSKPPSSTATGSAPASSPAAAGGKVYELKLSTPYPPNATSIVKMFNPWAKAIENDTNGRVKITIYTAQSLGKAADQYEMLRSGVCDIAVIVTGLVPGAFPLSEITDLPGLFTTGEIAGRAVNQLMNKYAVTNEYKNIKLLFIYAMPPMQFWTTKPVQTLGDFKGLKIATEAASDAKAAEALGASTVVMAVPDVYTALQTNMVQGCLLNWNGGFTFKVNEVTKYRTHFDLFAKTFPIAMNLNVWNSLPPDIQQTFEKNSGPDASARYGAIMDVDTANSQKLLEEYDKKVGNPGIFELSAAEKDKWLQALAPLYDSWAKDRDSKGLPGKAIVEEAKQLAKTLAK